MNYKDIIESKYDRESWQELLHDIFLNKVRFNQEPKIARVSSRLAKEALYLGRITLSDGESIAIYEVELVDKVDIERNRRGIRDMLTSNWKDMGYAGAFVFCYRKNESLLRFSYISETWGFNSEGEYQKISTDTRRYTYLLGEGRGCRTAIEQFTNLKKGKQTLNDITQAFSVESLTKQFYDDLFKWYQWAIDDSANVTFPNSITTEDDDRDDIEKKIIRMITRIMFVWFIKQENLVPSRIFDSEFLTTILKDFDPLSTIDGNFYNAILQNLFFATLNRAIVDEHGEKRKFASSKTTDIKTLYRYSELFSISEEEVIDLFSEVPFLNGGLFECLDKTCYVDGVEQSYNFDGFSRNDERFADGRYKNRAVVPNVLFFDQEKGLISILNRYNFTIEENSPEEFQVALDPELLGRVFENLLGVYNPETKETARKQSGSFYTPREIVNYMVDESLIAYLGDDDFVRSLFSNNFTYDKRKEEDYLKIGEKLQSVKIFDPACGSGAFPMGLLSRITNILMHIYPNKDVYELKLSIIEKCIFGCDIQSIATQITKLRFFISLICNCKKDSTKPNFGIPILPNLETNFVSANSLIAQRKGQIDLFENPEIENTKKELQDVRHSHFSAKSTSRKLQLRKKDYELREKLVKLLAKNCDYNQDEAKQLAAWNPYDQNEVSPFFDPEWMFGIKNLFDIIIGNPPYIQLQHNHSELANLYKNCNFESFERTGDIYCLFYERGLQLLKDGGVLCYITSNKWMKASYGEKLRKIFTSKTKPLLLINFDGVKVFESATVDTNILLFSKFLNPSNRQKATCIVVDKKNTKCINLSSLLRHNKTVCEFCNQEPWVIKSSLEQEIERKVSSKGLPLKEWPNFRTYRGILTGCNEAFIISTEKRDEILASCKDEQERERTAELIRPILRGKDIEKYRYAWNDLWLINTHNGIPNKLDRVYIDKYPAIKRHLDKFIERLNKRQDKGDTPYNLRHCVYMDNFCKPKIVYREISQTMEACLINEPMFLNNKCYFITCDKLEYVLAFLNSKLFEKIILSKTNQTGGRGRNFIESIKLIPPSKNEYEEFTKLYSDFVNNKTTESCFDEFFFNMYELTEEEKKYLNN